MTSNDIIKDFLAQLDFLFPDTSDPVVNWEQRSYREDLFNLSVKAYGIVSRDDLRKPRDAWEQNRSRVLSPRQNRQVDEIIEAWEQWQFAFRILERHD